MNRLQANICLICVTMCWSMEIVIYSSIPEGTPAFATTCVTSFAGSLLLLAAFFKRMLAALRKNWRSLVTGSAILALLNAMYNAMFICGVKSFDITSGAFTYCMVVVLLPVVLLSLRRRIGLETLLSVVCVGTGIVLAVGKSLQGEQLPGLALMGGGNLLRAIFIVVLADMAKKHEPLAIAIFLGFFVGIISLVVWLWEDPKLIFGLPMSRTLIASWTIYSYFIVAIAQAFNTIAMSRVTATNATLVYSLEIVFSIIWGTFLPASLITPVDLTPSVLLGAAFIILGNLMEILDIRGKRTEYESTKQEVKR
ncbi:MAG: DMT family transporter [Victivallales bacterium]|nr:DMT family transporter [Victivallales bacterium]